MIMHAKRRDELVAFQVDDADVEWISKQSLSIGSHGYVQTGRAALLHRLILNLSTGDGLVGDHINGDKLDNRRVNLRAVTPSMSSANVKGRAASGLRGVYPNKSRWAAAVKQHGKKIHLGTYDTPEQAFAVSTAWRRANLPGWIERS